VPGGYANTRQAMLVCALAVVAVLGSAGLAISAMLAPAPAAVAPLLALICVTCPLIFAWNLPAAVARLRASPVRHERAVAKARRALARLPETEHPLGF
jgi:hypothetical protein